MDVGIKTLVRNLQAIMLSPEQIKSQLRFLEERGALNGKTVFANIADDQDECCTPDDDQGGSNYDPPGSGDCEWDSGFAPEQYHNVCDDVDDCNGKPIDFSPQGFTQTEQCKECGPDDSWQAGYWWEVRFAPGNFDQTVFSTAVGARDDFGSYAGPSYYLHDWSVNTTDGQGVATAYNAVYRHKEAALSYSVVVVRMTCAASHYETGFCSVEPPERCGDDWEEDGKTSITLKNGCFVASKCDPDAAASDLGCKECMDLCQNGVQWTFCATDDGGWVQYDKSGQRVGGKYDKYGARKTEVQPGQEGAYL